MSKTKKLLCLLMSIVMACTVFGGTVTAFAATTGTSGAYSYELINDGKEVRITKYNQNNAVVSIPNRIAGKPVTAIGSYAFSGKTRVANVYLPITLEAIEDHAFYQCNRLTFMTVTSKVDIIGDYAFAGCGRLEWITIFNGLQEIGDYAFAECGRLTKISLPSSVKSIGDGAFWSCGRLVTASLKGVETIGADAFGACNRLERVHFSSALKSIGDRAFAGDVRLDQLYFDGNAPELGDNVFSLSGNATLYHKSGKEFNGLEWSRFKQRTFLICLF